MTDANQTVKGPAFQKHVSTALGRKMQLDATINSEVKSDNTNTSKKFRVESDEAQIKRLKLELAELEKDMERLEKESNESELRQREQKRI